MIGWASASTLAMTGSSISSGRAPRTRPTRSRTSLAATSGSRVIRKRTVIWLVSDRLIDDITSMPSMPDRLSSSGWVTWLSTISALAPWYLVVTVTTGSSILGYSRTDRR